MSVGYCILTFCHLQGLRGPFLQFYLTLSAFQEGITLLQNMTKHQASDTAYQLKDLNPQKANKAARDWPDTWRHSKR